MKKILLFLLLSISFCTNTYAQDMPVISFVNKDSVYDFGSIGIGDVPRYQFEIKNTGTAPLIITAITCNNSDLKFQWPAKPLKPHKKALLVVIYNPKDPTAIGSFKNDVFITSNATQKPYPFIRVLGTVVPTRGDPSSSRSSGGKQGRGGRGR